MKPIFVSIYIFITIFTFSMAQAEEILLSAGSGPLDSIINPVKDAFEKETGIKINILFGSSSLAFKQLYKGVSEAGLAGTNFDDVIDILTREGFEVTDPGSFRSVTLGKGKIRTVVNKANPVSKLSKDQLKGIFTGKITNWKDVGGNDSPIIVVLSTLNPATIGTFKKLILDNEPFTRDILELGHMDELSGAVEVNSEAIAIGTPAIVNKKVKQVETPDISRPIILFTKGEPSPKIQKFIDYILKGPGKRLVKE